MDEFDSKYFLKQLRSKIQLIAISEKIYSENFIDFKKI